MRVTGPEWESTQRLRDALRDTPPLGEVLRWGGGGKNGLEQLRLFKKNGIPCPSFTTSLQEAKRWVEEGEAEVWGRSLHHTQGKDIQLPKKLFKVREGRVSKLKWIITRKGNRVQREVETHKIVEKMGTNPKWETSDFWVKVIPSQEEFRQHVWKGNVIRRGKKEGGQEVTRKYPSVLIRSRQNGFHINYGPFESPRGMKDLAKKAVSVLGYKGGAVDLLQGRDGILYVLEVNSAPSLKDDNTLKAYVDGVKRDGV